MPSHTESIHELPMPREKLWRTKGNNTIALKYLSNVQKWILLKRVISSMRKDELERCERKKSFANQLLVKVCQMKDVNTKISCLNDVSELLSESKSIDRLYDRIISESEKAIESGDRFVEEYEGYLGMIDVYKFVEIK